MPAQDPITQAAALRERARHLRITAQYSDDPRVYRAEIDEANRLDAQAAALEQAAGVDAMPVKPAGPKPDNRRAREIAKIHIAKHQLGIDDDTYRQILREIGGAESSTKLTAIGRARVLEHFRSKGFTGKPKDPKRPKNLTPQLAKIEALLADQKLPWSYAIAIAKRMYGKDRLEFCTGHELIGITTALIKRAAKQA